MCVCVSVWYAVHTAITFHFHILSHPVGPTHSARIIQRTLLLLLFSFLLLIEDIFGVDFCFITSHFMESFISYTHPPPRSMRAMCGQAEDSIKWENRKTWLFINNFFFLLSFIDFSANESSCVEPFHFSSFSLCADHVADQSHRKVSLILFAHFYMTRMLRVCALQSYTLQLRSLSGTQTRKLKWWLQQERRNKNMNKRFSLRILYLPTFRIMPSVQSMGKEMDEDRAV